MLEGIEVLNQIEITTKPDWAAICGIISVSMLSIFVIAMFISIAKDKEIVITITFILTILSTIVTIIFLVLYENIKIPTGKYEYQVTIDKSVSMTEFYEKYEIVDVEGKIYTIKEK